MSTPPDPNNSGIDDMSGMDDLSGIGDLEGVEGQNSTIDRLVQAYHAYATNCALADPGESNADATAPGAPAWEQFRAQLAAFIAQQMPTDVDGTSEAEGLARGWVSRLREVALSDDQGGAFWESALLAALWRALAAGGHGETATRMAGLSIEDFLHDLPQRRAGVLARLFLEYGEIENARRFSSKASVQDPDDLASRFEVAMASNDEPAASATLAASMAMAESGMAGDPEELSDRQTRLAILQSDNHALACDTGSALLVLDQALRASALPSAELLLARGLALRAAGRPCAALADLAAASTLGAPVLLELGVTRLRMGDPEAAMAFFAEAESDPACAQSARVHRADAQRTLGTPDAAIETLSVTFGAGGRHAGSIFARAVALTDLGQGETAARLLIDANPPPRERARWLRELGRAFRMANQLESARGCLEQALGDPAAGFPELVEWALLEVAQDATKASAADVIDRHTALALRLQEYCHATSWTEATDDASRAMLEALVAALAPHDVRLSIDTSPTLRCARLNLASDRVAAPAGKCTADALVYI